MLKLSRQLTVCRSGGPAIPCVNLAFWDTNVYHWLNRKDHSLFHNWARIFWRYMQNAWFFMELNTHSMPRKFIHNGITFVPSIVVDFESNITKEILWSNLSNANVKTFLGVSD
jgi:hypothetical protein